MSAYETLQTFYKHHPGGKGNSDPKTVKDPWALGVWLARTHGKHTAAEYASAIERKRDYATWNPVSGEYTEKKEKRAAKKKEKESEAAPKKERAAAGTKKYGSPGRQARMKLSLDESIEILNILKAKVEEEKPKIKEDKKDEHEDKEPIKDPFAVASWRAEREGHDLSTDKGKERRKEIVEDIKEEGNVVEDEDVKKSASLQKISPGLAGLMAAAAGWALSDSMVEAGGGSPRGNMTPQQIREWERTVRRTMRKKDMSLDKESWESLQKTYYDDADLYFRKVPVQNAVVISKDHAPVPPKQGLQWDELKKKWVTAEHLGKSVGENQGKKRIRGSGTGVHEHSLAGGRTGGKGEGSGEAGRRFRGVADAGVLKPHESKREAGYSKHKVSTTGKGPKTAAQQASAKKTQRGKVSASNRLASHARHRLRRWGGPVAAKAPQMAGKIKETPAAKGPAIKQ